MATPPAESSSAPAKPRPVVVRVKRKANQEPLDAFWLEISERPLKRPLLDLENLSISDLCGKVVERSRSKKLLVQHVQTITSSGAIKDVLPSLLPHVSGSSEPKRKIEERRSVLKQDKKQDQLRSAARQNHENLVRSARFEQIWKSRRGRTEAADDSLLEICHLYDVVRIDSEEELSVDVHEPENISTEDNAILCNYLPLLREFIPEAAAEIESDMFSYAVKEDNYVYDLYTVDDGLKRDTEEASAAEYPLIQVDEDDDYYDGPLQSEYETDDSNAEGNPLFDYPDEEESSEDKENGSGDEFYLEGSDSQCSEKTDDGDNEGEDDWRWGHRKTPI